MTSETKEIGLISSKNPQVNKHNNKTTITPTPPAHQKGMNSEQNIEITHARTIYWPITIKEYKSHIRCYRTHTHKTVKISRCNKIQKNQEFIQAHTVSQNTKHHKEMDAQTRIETNKKKKPHTYE